MNTHSVSVSKHAYISIVPENQSKYRDDSRFEKDEETGELSATIGAGPSDSTGLFGYVQSGINRDRDKNKDLKNYDVNPVLTEKKTMTEDEMIEAMFEAEENFRNTRYDYEFSPKGRSDGYNSNSFIGGLLKALGLKSKKPSRVPGWGKPAPEDSYKENENEGDATEGAEAEEK